MYDVQTNPVKNRLYITVGDKDYIDLPVYVGQIESACRYLAPGFTCVAVLNKEGLIRQKDEDLLFNTADLVYAYGARKIVYVRKTDHNSELFQRSLMNFQFAATVENVNNIQEADEILDERTPGRLQYHPN
jgi:DNA-binding LytR/AlgR family response regulator